jgi:protocatechuate 3,4-dioxygenase beta subunit
MTDQDQGPEESFVHLTPKGPDDAADTQADLDREMAGISADYSASGRTETQPRLDYAPYRSSILRHPTKDLHHADPETIELHAPAFG